jgi:hypothetical protein
MESDEYDSEIRKLMTKDELQKQLTKIVNLQGYEYRLWHYQASHSVLTIRAYHPANSGHNVHIVFETVYYIQLPISWTAGDFRLGTLKEHKNVAIKIELEDFKAEQLILFVAEPLNAQKVYLLCHSAHIEYDVPPLY